MPGSFDDVLEINDHGCLSPAGPLEIAKDETVVRLDVWIWQDGGACIAVQDDFPHKDRWIITTDADENHKGAKFQPGAATAKGLMVSKMVDEQTKTLQTKTFEWTEGILLVDGMTKKNTFQSKDGKLLVDGKVRGPQEHAKHSH